MRPLRFSINVTPDQDGRVAASVRQLAVRLATPVLLLAVSAVPAAAQVGCVVVGRDSVDLTGTVVQRILPAGSGAASATTGADTIWVLKLDRRLCVRRKTEKG